MSDQPKAPMSDDKLFTDDHGVPLLFDVAVPGDVVKARGITLETAKAHPAVAGPVDLELRIRAAIDAALPKVTERTAAAMREALEREVRASLAESDEQMSVANPDDEVSRG